jgi:NTP pyrophosphatase (non-canonical NTP hydrolase)
MGYYRSGKAIYFTNTSDAGNTDRELIADCDNEEKADFVLNRILGHSSNFIRNAIVTCSPDFHANMVSKAQFVGRMNGAIDALNKLDQVKKSLFYGRDNNLITEGQADVAALPSRVHSDSAVAFDIIHAILGIATEAGELLELLKATLNSDGDFDWVNCREELGDIDWYKALLANRGDFTFEEVMELIIKKLRARYADKFTSNEAVERNLAAERAILEDMRQPLAQPAVDGPVEGPTEPLALTGTQPVSGKTAVEAAEAHSNAAFAALDSHVGKGVDAPVTKGSGGDLHKPRAERNAPLDDEHLARQPVRPEDLK